MDNINIRIKKIREAFCGGKNVEFAKRLGVKPTVTTNWVRDGYSVGVGVASKIARTFNVNIDWILTGTGVMSEILPENPTPGKLIPLYDAEAAAGRDEINMMPARPVAMIEIGSILIDSESALRVYGNSMEPNYPAGSIIGLRQYHDKFIEPGTAYVVETAENRYLKRLYYNADKTAFRCVSDNTMVHESGAMKGELYYQDFEIPFADVRKLFRVVGVIKRNIL